MSSDWLFCIVLCISLVMFVGGLIVVCLYGVHGSNFVEVGGAFVAIVGIVMVVTACANFANRKYSQGEIPTGTVTSDDAVPDTIKFNGNVRVNGNAILNDVVISKGDYTFGKDTILVNVKL